MYMYVPVASDLRKVKTAVYVEKYICICCH